MADTHYPACRTGACKGGRIACPTPDACRLPLDDGHDDGGFWLLGMPFGEFVRDLLVPGIGSAALLAAIVWLIVEIAALLHNTGKLTP